MRPNRQAAIKAHKEIYDSFKKDGVNWATATSEAKIKAKDLATKITETDPSFYKPWNTIANYFWSIQDYADALIYYEKALYCARESKMGRLILFKNLGLVYSALKNYTKSLEYYRQALSLSPPDANLYWDMGCVLYNMNMTVNKEEIIELWTKACRLNPKKYIDRAAVSYIFETEAYAQLKKKVSKQSSSPSKNLPILFLGGLIGVGLAFSGQATAAHQLRNGNAN